MKATLDQSAIKVAYAAAGSELESRPILQHVRIGEGKIVACNGFMLAVREIPTEPKTGEFILVDAKMLLKAQKFFVGKKLIIESQDTKFAIIMSDLITDPVINIPLLPAKYPSYKQVLPVRERKAYVALGIEYLAKTLKAADLEDNIHIEFKLRRPTDPLEITAGKTTIYIMPMAIEEKTK